MAILCRDIGLLLLQAPHTGSTSLGTLLRTELGGEMLLQERVRDERGRIVLRQKHQTLAQLLKTGLISPEQRRGLLVVVGIRNPFDLVFTEYARNREAGAISAPQRLIRRLRWISHDFSAADFERFVQRRYEPGVVYRLAGRRPFVPVDWTAGADRPHPFRADAGGPGRGPAQGGRARAASAAASQPHGLTPASRLPGCLHGQGPGHRQPSLCAGARAPWLHLRR